MKRIPVDDFFELVKRWGWKHISENNVKRMLEAYGDDWYCDNGSDEYELCNVNEERKKQLSEPLETGSKEE